MKKFSINDDWSLYNSMYYKLPIVDTLLVTTYWLPYNNPGALRWIKFGQFMDFTVLTSKKPKRGFYDETLPKVNKYVRAFGKNIPAFLWGILAIFKVPLNYKNYIITAPPESLFLLAYILQLLGKNVIVDVRDKIDREEQKFKILVPFYQFIYSKLKNVVVAWNIIDSTKKIIYHGYDDIGKVKFKGYYDYNLNHADYLKKLKNGYVKSYKGRVKKYALSSYHSIKRAGLPIDNISAIDENEKYGTQSWEEGAEEFNNLLKKIEKK